MKDTVIIATNNILKDSVCIAKSLKSMLVLNKAQLSTTKHRYSTGVGPVPTTQH